MPVDAIRCTEHSLSVSDGDAKSDVVAGTGLMDDRGGGYIVVLQPLIDKVERFGVGCDQLVDLLLREVLTIPVRPLVSTL
jgi:hypothetical protein